MRLLALLLLLLFFACTDWDLPKDYPDTVVLSTYRVTDSSVTLKWTKASDTNFGSYVVYKGDGEVIDTSDEVLDTIVFSVDTTYTADGLTAGTDYSFRVMVTSPEGTYTVSNVVKTQTLVDLNSVKLKLKQPDTTQITESSVALQWDFDAWQWSDTLPQYTIYMDTTSTVDSLDSLVGEVVGAKQAVVTQLEANKKYFFRVYLEHEDTSKAGSNVIEIQTKDGFPEAVSLVDTDSIGGNWASLKFTQSVDSDFAYYCIWQSETKPVDSLSKLDSSSSFATVVPKITDTVATVSGLQYETEYHFSVYVVDTDGNFTPSNTLSLTTRDSLYEQFELTKNSVTGTGVSLTFATYTGSDFIQYEIRGSSISSDVTESDMLFYSSANSNDTVATISSLVHGTQYYFKAFVKIGSAVKSSNTVYNYPVVMKTPVIADSVVHLSWATLLSDPDFSAYKLYRSTQAVGGELLVKRFESMSETEYSDTLTTGTYYYRVFRVLNGSSTEGEPSNQVVVVVE